MTHTSRFRNVSRRLMASACLGLGLFLSAESGSGKPQWHGSPAEKLLEEDMSIGWHKVMYPRDLRDNRLEYKEFETGVFQKRIHQAEKTTKFHAYTESMREAKKRKQLQAFERHQEKSKKAFKKFEEEQKKYEQKLNAWNAQYGEDETQDKKETKTL